MRHRHGCGPRGHIEIAIPEAVMAMRGGRGWQGSWGPFHFDFGDEGWSGGRRGRRSKRMFESGELRLVLLKLIADEPRHGYDLIRAIEDLTGGEYAPSPGVVYPTLTLLQDMGLIEEASGEGARKSTNYQPIFEIVGWVPRPVDLEFKPRAKQAEAQKPTQAPAPSTGSTRVDAPTAPSAERQPEPALADDFG